MRLYKRWITFRCQRQWFNNLCRTGHFIKISSSNWRLLPKLNFVTQQLFLCLAVAGNCAHLNIYEVNSLSAAADSDMKSLSPQLFLMTSQKWFSAPLIHFLQTESYRAPKQTDWDKEDIDKDTWPVTFSQSGCKTIKLLKENVLKNKQTKQTNDQGKRSTIYECCDAPMSDESVSTSLMSFFID